ncbi:hypothetical protein H0H87_000460 [Tephrocybe sp. NHM501043]|nr:hypothetical protein H0H87_000460 [Tephrocybe sp. NHM501043]
MKFSFSKSKNAKTPDKEADPEPVYLGEDWTLNEAFFNAYNKWSKEHPESYMQKVIWPQIISGIENGKDFLELIPNPAPLPIRGIVKSMGKIVQLGAEMQMANGELKKFADEVITFIDVVNEKLQAAGGATFTKDTTRNLLKMSETLGVIIAWTEKRLKDKRWSFGKVVVPSEIKKFKALIAEAHKSFQTYTLIDLSLGIRRWARTAKHTDYNVQTLLKTLQSLKLAYEENSRVVAEDAIVDRDVDRDLHPSTVAKPTYTEQKKLPCSEGTRVKVLSDIRCWINDFPKVSHVSETSQTGDVPSSSSQPPASKQLQNFLWLTGDPGSGKSAVTASIAKECSDRHVLWAQFFINRNNTETTQPRLYFPSIARQFAEHSRAAKLHIHKELLAHPSIIDTAQEASNLFLEAIRMAASIDTQEPVVVVIDGLDETNQGELKQIANIFSNLFEKLAETPNAKILISSRTEDDIYRPFTAMLKKRHVKHISLDTSESYDDVTKFMTERLTAIFEEEAVDGEEWLRPERMKKLADQAAGLFIWAVTAVNLLGGHVHVNGREGLGDLWDDLTQHSQMKQLNQLYEYVLDLAHRTEHYVADSSNYEVFRRLMGAILVAREPLTVQHLDELLALRRKETSTDYVDIPVFVRRFRTVLLAGLEEVNQSTKPRLHKSFFEYITSGNPKEQYRVDLQVAHAEMALQCLNHLAATYSLIKSAHFSVSDPQVETLPYHLQYAQRFCATHLLGQDGNLEFGVILDNSIQYLPQLTSLLHRSSHAEGKGPLATIIHEIQQNSQHTSTILNDQHLIWNTKGSKTEPVTLPLKHLYAIQSISISPNGFRLLSASKDDPIAIWSTQSLKAVETRLMGHLDSLSCVAYSKFSEETANMFVSSGDDGTLHIWDATTGNPGLVLGRPDIDVSDGDYVCSLTFSHGYIVLGASSGSVEVWDVSAARNPTMVSTNPFRQFKHQSNLQPESVNSVDVCSTGEWILSASDDGTLALWSISGNEQIGGFLTGHERGILSAAISPDQNYFVSGSLDEKVLLWSSKTQKQLGDNLATHDGPVHSVAFSPCGHYIASASKDQVILSQLDTQNANCHEVMTYMAVFGAPPCPLAFSPRGQLVFCDGDQLKIINVTPHLCDMRRSVPVSWTIFSPSGNFVVSCNPESSKLSLLQLDAELDVMRPSLDCRNAAIEYIAFSSDESLIVGASTTGLIFVWKALTSTLALFTDPALSIPDISTIFFKDRDDMTIVVEVKSGKTKLVNLPPHLDGMPSITESSDTFVSPAPIQFVVGENPRIYGTGTASNHRLKTVRWFSCSGSQDNRTFWACINNHLIRGSRDGRYVVVPFTLPQAQ